MNAEKLLWNWQMGRDLVQKKALMMVTNPTGQYKLTADLDIMSDVIYASENFKVPKDLSSVWRCFYKARIYHDLHSMEIDLPEMDRYKYKWHMFVTSYGPLKETETESKSEFEKWLKDKVESWQGKFDTAEASENGSKNAIATFMDAMESLDNMKSAIKAYSGAGTYQFVLQRDNSDTPIKTHTIIIQ